MKQLMGSERPRTDERQFRSVAETARMFGVSEMTLYRAIRDGQFPAVRIMGRLIVPLRVIEAMASAAVDANHLVDAADWVERGSPSDAEEVANRPRPGANQTGAGSFSTQHAAGYGEDVTPSGRAARGGGAR